MKKVSVIVPVYNVEKYLKKCHDSLVNQTLKEIEIIVVNDGSPDNSESICLESANRSSNFFYYKKTNNNGEALTKKAIVLGESLYVCIIYKNILVNLLYT